MQQPLGVVPDEASFVNVHHLSTSLILIILFGIAVLATLCIYLCRLRFSIERSVEAEPKEQAQLKRGVVERLSCIRSDMENTSKTILEIRLGTGLDITTASALSFPSGHRREGNNRSISTENVAGRGETSHQANLLIPGPSNEMSGTDINSEQDLSEVAVKMRELVELSHRLQAAAQVFDTYNIAPSLEMGNEDDSAQSRRYLPFFLDDELFAVSIRSVKEIVEANRLIFESDRSRKIRRAINLRGSVVPVIDLSGYFGGKPTEVNQSTLIIILVVSRGEHRQMIGVKVDAICKILNITPSSIEPPLVQKVDIRSRYTIGTVRIDNRSISLLDISQGLSAGIFSEPNSASSMLE
ncbi:Positive regulator of CheA protein activity (CheW) [Pseudomonas chlororaphis]|uniref:Positive regulator of CheA protein activity (CheW) n=1 Tax=Pseudomonas chlororaphis TaxID=587753 RepID=A0A3G7TW46_9PSED|nr:chemotaxis protein CheW [Pseudomonas chlororaphis]AZE51344.1 Positive regulator of CheA protein activity (CheW) [Pseudomonas chlororaphis]